MAAVVATVITAGDQVLLIRESIPGHPWYVPAGRVEYGESLADAARRECWEEAGVAVTLTGVLGLTHQWRGRGPWVRVVFAGTADPRAPLKSVPDRQSHSAAWVDRSAVRLLRVRSPDLFAMLALADSPPAPLSILGPDSGLAQPRLRRRA
ncbi:hypothetical protein BZG35_08400 [Brevundimonas sp. LM2]|uniref:NUDIX hydrolase n=1 Tax=Brevundimonas sp. LM2 TaxID=1938605 RepID=UPI0009839136|nr:NUDIX hydrolase [Brevundimonas sp. LM2]AQR61669.1 hypothetical protein BZG35_08400 [Brevundimonas sp. LM2]